MKRGLLTALLLALAACGGQAPDERAGPSDVVLITVESWWHQPGGGEGDPFAGFETEGFVRVADAMTPCPQTLPAVAALLAGEGPDRLGVLDDLRSSLSAETPVLAERLKDAGWRTVAFVAHSLLGRDSGLARGFEIFDAPPPYLVYGPSRRFPPVRDTATLVDNVLEWLAQPGSESRPAFAWLHLAGPHFVPQGESPEPDAPSPAAGVERLVAGLRERDRLDRTEIWVVGTSGSLDRTPEGGGYVLTPRVLRVPVLHHPAADGSPVAATDALWTPDIAAAVLVSAGLEPDLGESRRPGLRGPRLAWTWLAALDMGWRPAVAAVGGARLVVLESDGGTTRVWDWEGGSPLPEAEPPAALAEAARERMPTSRGVSVAPEREIPEELRDALVAAALPAPERAGTVNGTDEEGRMQSLGELLRARRLAAGAARAPTLRSYRSALALDPMNRAATLELGQLLSMNRPIKARERLEAAREMDPFEPEVWHGFGHVALTEKDYEKADAALRLSAFLHPASGDVLYDLACTGSLLGKLEESSEYLRRAWEAGFRNVDHIQADPDLRNLREDARYAAFMRDVVR